MGRLSKAHLSVSHQKQVSISLAQKSSHFAVHINENVLCNQAGLTKKGMRTVLPSMVR